MTAELVRQATHVVKIAGTTRDADSVSIERSIATSMPAQVAGGGGVVKASGTIGLGEPDKIVTTERDSPWFRIDGWPPARNSSVTVDTALNDTEPTRRFTGRVAAVQSSTRDHVALDIEDYTDRLKSSISHWPLLRTMPPPGSQTGDMLNVGLRADYLANVIFRRAGFYITPPVMGVGCLSVPAQGSMWPEIGTCRSCTEGDGTATLPSWYPAPWGWAVGDVAATYGPPNFGNQTLRGRAIALGMMIDRANTSNEVRMDVRLGTATITLRVAANLTVEVLHGATSLGTFSPGTGWTRLEAIFRGDGTVRVHCDNDFSQVVSWSPGGVVLDGAYTGTDTRVRDGARAAGFVVQFTPTSYSGGYTSPAAINATIVPGTLIKHMRAMPSITSREGLDLLIEISKALVISMWIDREGHLWWVHPDALLNQEPALELTSTADLLDLAWQDTSDSARRQVTVTYDDPAIRRKARYKLTAWEGSGDNLDQGESSEEIVDPGTNVDWIEVAGLGQAIYATPAPSNPEAIPGFNRGIGSWVGGSHINADGETPATMVADGRDVEANAHEFPDLSRTLERIGPAAWNLTVGLEDIADNYWVSIQQSLDLDPALGSKINGSWNGQRMPILRCKAITDWEPQEYTSSITGDAQYDGLDHNTGPWAGDGVPALADWLARQVTNPAPILRDLPIVWRDDIQVGQVITVTEDVVYNVRLTCLVIGLREDHTRGSSTMRLTCRVINVERITWTYDEQSRYWNAKSGDYDDLTATGQTYDTNAVPPADLASVLDTPLIEPLPAPMRPWWPDEWTHEEEVDGS